MSLGSETLDQISRRGEAVFATDSADRIILWNKKCEELLGRPMRRVLGRRCDEVVRGRDVYGNLYCHRCCPVAFQARLDPAKLVNRFSLSVDVHERERRIRYSMFVLPSYHPRLSILVHVLRAERSDPRIDRLDPEPEILEPLWPNATASGESFVLTLREKEILLCLAEGLESAAVARRLLISRATVRNHISKILLKLDVHSKLAAVVFAYQHNLLDPSDAHAQTRDSVRERSTQPRRRTDSGR